MYPTQEFDQPQQLDPRQQQLEQYKQKIDLYVRQRSEEHEQKLDLYVRQQLEELKQKQQEQRDRHFQGLVQQQLETYGQIPASPFLAMEMGVFDTQNQPQYQQQLEQYQNKLEQYRKEQLEQYKKQLEQYKQKLLEPYQQPEQGTSSSQADVPSPKSKAPEGYQQQHDQHTQQLLDYQNQQECQRKEELKMLQAYQTPEERHELIDRLCQQQGLEDRGKGKGKAPVERSGPHDVPHHPEHIPRFNNQVLTEIYPRLNLEHITDRAEKQGYYNVLVHYVQAFHKKAAEAHPEILQHYNDKEIYFRCYMGRSSNIVRLIAVCDKRDNRVFVGPNHYKLKEDFGIDAQQYPNVYKGMSMQEVDKYHQEGKSVQYSTYDVLRPAYKQIEIYQGKKGSIGLYCFDNDFQLIQDFGGASQSLSGLYNGIQESTGPWILPKGAVIEVQQAHASQAKPWEGQVISFN